MGAMLARRLRFRVEARGPRPEAHLGERGAALVTVLLFMVLVFILITSMLSVTGNEIVIAGLQRDGVRALDLAQAGVQEMIRRMEEGRPYNFPSGFPSSLAVSLGQSPTSPFRAWVLAGAPCPSSNPSVCVTVTAQYLGGSGAAYQLITAKATNIGRATRTLSALVLQQQISVPPDVTFASSVSETGSATVASGDVYSRTFIQYKTLPIDPNSLTYAGWRVSKTAASGPPIPNCYKYTQPCGNSKWYPGTRRTESEVSSLGQDILAMAAAAGPGCTPPPDRVEDSFDWQVGDRFATYGGAGGPDAEANVAGSNVKLYGFDTDGGLAPGCGLPYKWVREVFTIEDGVTVYARWFKTIVFEQWLNNYWYFDEAAMTFKKKTTLVSNPQYGAIPPLPNIDSMIDNYDCKLVAAPGGSTLNSLPQSCTRMDGTTNPSGDLGCKLPEMTEAYCASGERTVTFRLDGDWLINGTIRGHGALVVNGNLTVAGTFEYWGTVFAKGDITAATGNVKIHGGVAAEEEAQFIGNLTVYGGATVGGTPPTGRSLVIGKAWWER